MSAGDLLLILFLALPLVLGGLAGLAVRRHRRSRRGRLVWLVLGNALLTLTLVGALLAAGEIYYRFVYDESDGFQLAKVGLRWTERHYRYNDAGMRDDVDYPAARSGGRPRGTILGDSYTNGYGLTDVDARFANLLRREHPGWEVQILAEDGLDTGPLLARLQRGLASGYELEWVVYAYVLNDISDLIPEWQ